MDLRRSQVLAFRAGGHGLTARRPRTELVEAFAAVGLRRTKDTALAAATRVEGAAAEDVDRALGDGRLVAVYGARGTLMIVPSDNMAVFTPRHGAG